MSFIRIYLLTKKNHYCTYISYFYWIIQNIKDYVLALKTFQKLYLVKWTREQHEQHEQLWNDVDNLQISKNINRSLLNSFYFFWLSKYRKDNWEKQYSVLRILLGGTVHSPVPSRKGRLISSVHRTLLIWWPHPDWKNM